MSHHSCIVLDPNYCINCKACEIHCIAWNGLTKPLGRHYGDFPYMENGKMLLQVEFFACMHCVHPLCFKACKLGAMFIDEENMVGIDPEKCTGCCDCIAACPTKLPFLNEQTGKVVKCDLCSNRRANGEEPACVAGCPSNALTYSEDGNVHKLIMKKLLQFIRKYGK